MTAIAKSSRAAEILKPKTALEISMMEDYFARLFYKYLFKAKKIDQFEYSKSLIPGRKFALSTYYERNDIEGFLKYLKQRGVLGVAVPLEPVIVVESVPLIEQFGFGNALSQTNNIKISQFINGLTGKLRIILFNYQVYNKIDQFGRVKKVETANHWVCVELSRNTSNPRTITATIIDSKVVDPRLGSKSIASLVAAFVTEAVLTFGPHRNARAVRPKNPAKNSSSNASNRNLAFTSDKTTKFKPYIRSKVSNPNNEHKVKLNFVQQRQQMYLPVIYFS